MDEQTTDDERPVRRVTPMEGADILLMYLTRRREMLIIELVARLLGISIKEAEEIIKSESLNTIGYDVFDDGKPHVGVSIFDV